MPDERSRTAADCLSRPLGSYTRPYADADGKARAYIDIRGQLLKAELAFFQNRAGDGVRSACRRVLRRMKPMQQPAGQWAKCSWKR
jgi:hypothetical protein